MSVSEKNNSELNNTTTENLEQQPILNNDSTETTESNQAIENTSNDTSVNLEDKNTTSKTEDKILDNKEVTPNSEGAKNSTPKIEIPKENYSLLSLEELAKSLNNLFKNFPVQLIKEQVEEIRTAFNTKFDAETAKNKAIFIAEGGNEIDFYYTTPLKKQFNELYFTYKDAKNQHYKTLKTNLENNLKTRLQIIDNLKTLIASPDSVNQKFNVFKELKEQWHQAGAIPRDQNNVVWNTYNHHVDKFYEVVHLNREFRDLDFKHNLEQKIKIIDRAKELSQETNINRAFRELQVLHKIWKEEIGPVAREYKDLIWDKFSELSQQIHDTRQQYFKEQEAKQEENLIDRKAVIEEINTLAKNPKNNHADWQKAIAEVATLNEKFKKIGRVPNEQKNTIWDEFRAAERYFNKCKNEFYKTIKDDQLDNLAKKKALIEVAEANKDNDDSFETTSLMKKIQNDWKKIGHVPRKDSDKIWLQFKNACNHYFDKISTKRDAENQQQLEAFSKKTTFLETLKTFSVTDLDSITTKINEWKAIGSVPFKKRKIEEDFSLILDGFFKQLNLNRKDVELIKFETKIAEITDQNDEKLISNEKNFVRKKMDESKAEILQLQNNLQFFKHADKSNPLVADVYKKIEKHEDDFEIWKSKWNIIKKI